MEAWITLVWTLVSMALTFLGLAVRDDGMRALMWIVGFLLALVSGVAWFHPTVTLEAGGTAVLEGAQGYAYISLLFAFLDAMLLLMLALSRLAG